MTTAPRLSDGKPGYYVPYFLQGPLIENDPRDYADETAVVRNAKQYVFMHPLGSVVTALIDAGLTLNWLHEHDAITWRMFDSLVQGRDRFVPMAEGALVAAGIFARGKSDRAPRKVSVIVV